MKVDKSRIALVLVLVLGVGVMLYPTVSDWWNSRTQTRAIASYDSAVGELSEENLEVELAAAQAYNEALANLDDPLVQSEDLDGYEDVLDVTGTGIMGYVSIPKIDVEIPIYHGTDEGVLQIAAGHLEGSSLPVGGAGTHCVISAHRGLPSARLFSDLDQLEVGDRFTLSVLGETLTYEVDQIHIVEPDDVSDLSIVEGEDYCTLLTCTPYGVNTHRLLVRGHRVANEASAPTVHSEAYELDSLLLAPVLAVPVLVALLVVLLVRHRSRG